jgi:nucleotide-binding universal stress UspA family protein
MDGLDWVNEMGGRHRLQGYPELRSLYLTLIKTREQQQSKLCFFMTKEQFMYQRILVATDGSTLSKKAVASAIDLAALAGAELIALKVIPRYPQSYFEGGLALQVEEVSRVEQQWADDGQAVVDAVQKAALDKGVKTKAITVKSDLVSDAIIAAAKKHKCDLIVMASHGRKGIKRLLLGSETQQVLTHASVPVLVLR